VTAPVLNLTINISDTGRVTLSAADAAAEGHLWAIETKEISLRQLHQVAAILGPDAVQGVESRLAMVLDRLDKRASVEEEAAERARQARLRHLALRSEMGLS
jgi:hypothetical protein